MKIVYRARTHTERRIAAEDKVRELTEEIKFLTSKQSRVLTEKSRARFQEKIDDKKNMIRYYKKLIVRLSDE